MDNGASSGDDRATAAEPVVSALRDSVPSAVRRFLRWGFALASAWAGLILVSASTQADGLTAVIAGAGGVILVLGAMDAKAQQAKAAEQTRWAELIANMISKNGTTKFRVVHTTESLRPELDHLVNDLVAKAIEARRAETQGGSVHESAGGQASPKGGSHD